MAEAKIWILDTCLLLCWVAVVCAQENHGDQCIDKLGRDGVSSLFRDCPIAMEEFVRYKMYSLCQIPDSQSIVCCPHQQILAPSTPVTLPTPPWPSSEITDQSVIVPGLFEGPEPVGAGFSPNTNPQWETFQQHLPGERAKHYCKEYSYLCGSTPAIGGGKPALPDEYPHMAAIGYGNYNNIKWKCGGTLISEKFVLTAAHCVRSSRDGVAKWVLLGTVNLAANESLLDDGGQIHGVVERIRHPGYRASERYNDIALLQIGPALTRNARPLDCEGLHPACLKSEYPFDHTPYIATGWGRVQHGGTGSDELLFVELNVIDQITCNQTYKNQIKYSKRLSRGIDSTMLCAGNLMGGMDTCEGDSGGPLQKVFGVNCLYEVVGITSFGRICLSENSPSVYTKVSAFIEWIENIVWPLDSN